MVVKRDEKPEEETWFSSGDRNGSPPVEENDGFIVYKSVYGVQYAQSDSFNL